MNIIIHDNRTKKVIVFILGLKSEVTDNSSSDSSEEEHIASQQESRTDQMTSERRREIQVLTLKKGKRPNGNLGLYHKLMELCWEVGKIESIFDRKEKF